MNSKRKLKIIIAIIIVIALILIVAGKSYSKYINQVYGRGIIKVADWSFLVNGENTRITNISLANTYKVETLKENTIAPGTKGAFNLMIDANGSEVGIEYKVIFENETQKPSNLKFIYGETVVNSLKELEPLLIGEIKAQDAEKIKNMEIKWVWEYEIGENKEQIQKSDEIDTKDGKLLENYKFDVIIEGCQIEPQV